jgi:hypothetical protein
LETPRLIEVDVAALVGLRAIKRDGTLRSSPVAVARTERRMPSLRLRIVDRETTHLR